MNPHKNFLYHLAEWWETRQTQPDSLQVLSAPTSKSTRLRHWLTPNGGTLILVVLLILTQNLWASPNFAPMEGNVPGPSATTVNYQGRLADTSGVPENGTFSMSFTLYDATTDGNVVWGPEVHGAVPVSEGLFSVGLGSLTAGGIPTTTWNGDIYLEVSVNGEALSPRELIRSVPIAGMALTVPDGAIGSEQIEAGAITQEVAPSLVKTARSSNIKVDYGAASGNNSCTPVEITFHQSFSGPPIVMLTQNEAVGGYGYYITTDITKNGFKAHQIKDCTTNYGNIQWIAIGN